MSDRCDNEVFRHGKRLCILDASSAKAETWVRMVANRSGQKVDWHLFAGRAIVLYIGNYHKCVDAIRDLENLLVGTILKVCNPDESRP